MILRDPTDAVEFYNPVLTRSIRILMKNPIDGYYAIYSVTPISFKWYVMIVSEYNAGTG